MSVTNIVTRKIKRSIVFIVIMTIGAGVFGYLGLVGGILLLEGIGPGIDSDFFSHPEVDLKIAFFTTIVLIIAGGFAGFFPARKAAMIKPIEALRDE